MGRGIHVGGGQVPFRRKPKAGQEQGIPTPGRWERLEARGEMHPGIVAVGILIAFVLGRALPSTMVAPFGLAFLAGVRGGGWHGIPAILVAAAVGTGAWSVLPPIQTVWVAGALLVCSVACSLLGSGRKGLSPVGAAAVAAASAWIPAIPRIAAVPVVEMLFWAGVAGTLAQVFAIGIHDITAGSASRRTGDSTVSLIVLLAAALCGLEGLLLFDRISVHDIAAALLIMISALQGGVPGGAIASAILGISFLFTAVSGDQSSLLSVLPEIRGMAYVVAGVLAGSFRDLGKIGVTVAFGLGIVTYTLVFTPSTPDIQSIMISAASAAGILYMLPLQRLKRGLTRLMGPSPEGEDRSQLLPLPMESRISTNVHRLAGVLREVAHMFEQVAAVKEGVDTGVEEALENLSRRVCLTCSLNRQCWETDRERTRQIISALWEGAGEGALDPGATPPELEAHCIYPAKVVTALSLFQELQAQTLAWERRLDESRGLMTGFAKSVARLLERLAEGLNAPRGSVVKAQGGELTVTTSSASLPRRGSYVSGDSALSTTVGTDRHLLLLSDGMGVGREALDASKQCTHLLEQLLTAGFPTSVAVHAVNSLLLAGSDLERFVTIDITILDLATGSAEFIKVGAAPTFIKRGSDVSVVKVASVPAGIVPDVQIEQEHRQLRPGDLLVMITDGIWDAAKDQIDKEKWIISHLARESATDPAEVAEGLMARAMDRTPDAGDDITVLVARIDSTVAAAPRQQRVDEWAALRRAPRPRSSANS